MGVIYKLYAMKNITLIILVLSANICFSQQIKLTHITKSIETTYYGNEFKFVDSVFKEIKPAIFLVKLKPHCENVDCYEESIIETEFNWGKSKPDSIFAAEYFKGINKSLIDSTSIIEVNHEDYEFLLKKLLSGPKKLDENEVINICYNPRHAVIFKDEQGKIVAIHEVCFECGNTKVAIYTSKMHHSSSSEFKKIFEKYGLIK
jgi:hypothetical protein